MPLQRWRIGHAHYLLMYTQASIVLPKNTQVQFTQFSTIRRLPLKLTSRGWHTARRRHTGRHCWRMQGLLKTIIR